MSEQLNLAFDRGLPVAVSALAVKRAVCRHLREFGNDAARAGFELRTHLEEVATLEQVRQAAREQARELKREARQQGRRMKGRATIAYVCTTEGRRAQRWIERLSERIGARESGLCA
jgi:hypothetical protein